MKKNPLSRQKIEEMSIPEPMSGCWIWMGFLHNSGYGCIRDGKRTDLAHRASYKVFIGDISKDKEINHLCNNKSCVNPHHLEAVSHQKNIDWRDITGKTSKGPKHSIAMIKRNLRGENHLNSKLNNKKVSYIRDSDKSVDVLSSELNVSKSLIRQVRRHEIWKHIISLPPWVSNVSMLD